MFYYTKTPFWLKWLYPSCLWNYPDTGEKIIYLSFDDGPHPQATPFVLDMLKQYGAKACFFCIGKNVVQQPAIYKRILLEGHRVGNHTYNHLNGWKTDSPVYFENIVKAREQIDSDLFRPPYGRISAFQIRNLQKKWNYKVVMWDILSGDFDPNLSGEQSAERVIRKTRSGSIVVFHDSAKAFRVLETALPKVLEYFSSRGYRFEVIR